MNLSLVGIHWKLMWLLLMMVGMISAAVGYHQSLYYREIVRCMVWIYMYFVLFL